MQLLVGELGEMSRGVDGKLELFDISRRSSKALGLALFEIVCPRFVRHW